MYKPLSLRQLHYLLELDRHKSISDASKALHISQSSILAAVDVAEQIAETKLFLRRKGFGITATQAGRRFLISARRLHAANLDFEQSVREFAKLPPKVLRIGCFASIGAVLIPPVMRRYIDTYGDTDIILKEGDHTELRSWLDAGEVDFVMSYDIGEQIGQGRTPICRFPPYAVVHKTDSLAKKSEVTIEELSGRPFVLLDLPETRSYLISLFDIARKQPRIALRTRSFETVRAAVENGLGVSILNIRARPATDDKDQGIRLIPISDSLRQPTLFISDPYGEEKPTYLTAFIETLHRYLSDLGQSNYAITPSTASNRLLCDLNKK